MKIYLPDLAKDVTGKKVTLTIDGRLPPHVVESCDLICEFGVQDIEGEYYLLTLNIEGQLILTCQRCMKQYPYTYRNKTLLAVCDTDEKAERIMPLYDCIVERNYRVDLKQIITDDLHLYVPERHTDSEECKKLHS